MDVENYTATPIEQTDNPQAGISDFSEELNNFLKDIKKNKEKTERVLSGNKDLKDRLEAFLKNPEENNKGKINKLKVQLMKCKPEDVEGIIAGTIGYEIGNTSIIETEISSGIQINNNSVELLNQREEDVHQREEDVHQIENKLNETEKTIDLVAQMNVAIRARNNLVAGNKELDDKSRAEADEIKRNLQIDENTRQELESQGINDEFIDQYILVKVTLKEAKKDSSLDPSQVKEFEKLIGELDNGLQLSKLDIFFKRLDNACNIPDTGLNSFSDRNIGNTRAELFNDDIGNKNLQTLRDNNMKSEEHNEYYNTVFGPENIDINTLSDDDYSNIYNSYRNFLPNDTNINIQSLTQEDKELLLKTKIKIDSQSKKLIEEMCIVSQIKGMYMCIGKGDNFELNKAREIRNENGILTLNGHIDGTNFTIRQNTKDKEPRLETYSKLAKKGENTFTLGGAFKDSGFTMPSADQVFDTATGIDIKKIMEESNEGNYETALQAAINSKMDTLYSDTKYAHLYMKEQILGEKITEKTINILEKIKEGNVNGEIDNKNENLLNFVKTISFNIDLATADEKELLNNSLTKILEIINDKDSNNIEKSQITADYINNGTIKDTKDNLNSQGSDDKKLIFDFFDLFKKDHDSRNIGDNKIINVLELNNILSNPRLTNGYQFAESRRKDQNKGNEAENFLNENANARDLA